MLQLRWWAFGWLQS